MIIKILKIILYFAILSSEGKLLNFYAVQVKPRAEGKFIQNFMKNNPETNLLIHYPQRQIDIRRKGRLTPVKMAIFPGYVFVEAESAEKIHAYKGAFKKTPGFYRFLKSNKEILPLSNHDLEIVLHFIKNFGPVAGRSRVYFNENSRIVVVDGPLSGLEGRIIKVDKRKRRAKIKLDIYQDSFSIDLSFEVIGSMELPGGRM